MRLQENLFNCQLESFTSGEKAATHTKCKACHKQYPHLQLAYPHRLYYEEPILSVNTDELQLHEEKGYLPSSGGDRYKLFFF